MVLESRQRRVAVHPTRLNLSERSTVEQQQQARWQAQLQALLREHEPEREHQAPELLRAFPGMECELIQCYRHLYTGVGGFSIPHASAARAQREDQGRARPFSLPKAAIRAYLVEKKRRMQTPQRAVTSMSSLKGDAMRGPETPCRAVSLS